MNYYTNAGYSVIFLYSEPALLTLVLQLMVIYLPAANKVFKTNPLSMTDLVICLLLSTVVFHAVELEKYIKKNQIKKNSS
ncbi:MAG: cation-translocating P-type ATPase C-terminal domain-containing protein [Ignavibacteria bacterium]